MSDVAAVRGERLSRRCRCGALTGSAKRAHERLENFLTIASGFLTDARLFLPDAASRAFIPPLPRTAGVDAEGAAAGALSCDGRAHGELSSSALSAATRSSLWWQR